MRANLLMAFLGRVIPELALWETGPARWSVLWLAWRASGGITLHLSFFSGVVATTYIVVANIIAFAAGLADLSPETGLFVIIPLLWGLLVLAVAIVIRYRRVPLMRSALRRMALEHGIPACQVCGYDLRGILADRCPECGAAKPPVP